MILRSFRHGDEQSLIFSVNTAHRNLESFTPERVKRLTSPPYFNPQGFFIAEENGLPVGCVGVFNLPNESCLEIRYLAVKEAFLNPSILDGLVETALKYASTKQPKLVKAVTLTIQPYVETYQRFGFKPVRRILRIAWDSIKTLEEQPNPRITVAEICKEDVDEASQVFMEGLQPYWDWWIEEEGGEQVLLKNVVDWMKKTEYLTAKINNKIVGVTAVIPHPHPERNEASFSGVIVLPAFRMKGVGSALMRAALNKASQLGYKRLVVHTLAYLDALAPGAVLYLKTGGKIEAEYLHLIKESLQ
jgi:N-acetylglutamate synthase-like GNAT family acetyltransferase